MRTIDLSTAAKCHSFIERTGDKRGRRLANILGIHGKHSTLLADNINNYAHNRRCVDACQTENGRKIYQHCCELILVLISRCQAAEQVTLLK